DGQFLPITVERKAFTREEPLAPRNGSLVAGSVTKKMSSTTSLVVRMPPTPGNERNHCSPSVRRTTVFEPILRNCRGHFGHGRPPIGDLLRATNMLLAGAWSIRCAKPVPPCGGVAAFANRRCEETMAHPTSTGHSKAWFARKPLDRSLA